MGSVMTMQVGIPGHSGLSVEQRKRLTIAVELVANPSIVFMDEPTSGQSALVLFRLHIKSGGLVQQICMVLVLAPSPDDHNGSRV